MNIVQNCSNYFSGIFTPSLIRSSASEFQQAISQGNTALISELGKKNLLNKPLPNGELPLNHAIRQSQPESVQTLLTLGADPTQFDDQQLNAISTAYFKEDHELVEKLMSYVAKDMEIGLEMKGEGVPSKSAMHFVEAAKTSQQNILGIIGRIPQKVTNLKFGGNDPKLTKIILQLVQEKTVPEILYTSNEGLSYLHVAILTGNTGIVEKLLEKSDFHPLLNAIDNNGLTPLHYAAALGRMDLMKKLIDKGAVLQLNDESISYFALLAGRLNQQSPLAISKYDAAIFLCSTILWSAKLLPAQMINPRVLQTMQLAHYSPLIFNFDRSAIFFSLASFIGMNASYLSENLNFVSVGVNAALTLNLAYTTFQGLRACWRNSTLNNAKALRQAAVVHLPKAVLSLNQLRGLGQQLGMLSPTSQSQLQRLNDRDVKCLKLSAYEGKVKSKCFEKSLDVYAECTVNSDPESCQKAEQDFQDYSLRSYLSTYDNCDVFLEGTEDSRVFKHNDQSRECTDKQRKWRAECYHVDSDSENCQKAEQIFKSRLKQGFQPDYEDDYWREKFKYEYQHHRCPSHYTDEGKDCGNKKETWKELCEIDFHSDGCIKAERIFRKGVHEGFVPDYTNDFWRNEALKEYIYCPSDWVDEGKECRYKEKNWKDLCTKDLLSDECLKAETVFKKAKAENFEPDYTDDFWRKKFRDDTHYCPSYQSVDCNIKKENWINLCNVDMQSEECKKAEAIFRNGLKEGFEADPQSSSSYRKSEQDFFNQHSEQDFFNQHFKHFFRHGNAPSQKASCQEAVKSITGKETSTFKEMKKVFHKKVIKVHPDKPGGSQELYQKLSSNYEKATKCFEDKIL